MATVNQGMSVKEIEQIVAQRVANAIETIAIYETKTNMARKIPGPKAKPRPSMAKLKAERQAENKRKLDNNNQTQQQSPKRQKVAQAYVAGTGERKEYAGSLPLCNQCKFHHNGPCTIKCGDCKGFGHITRNCRTPTATRNQRTPTCSESGGLGHYKCVNMNWKGKAYEYSSAMTSNINI
ncbi:hypothetical protein Tco_0393945 [Tanacetum coccineum]